LYSGGVHRDSKICRDRIISTHCSNAMRKCAKRLS
jgi:hypothetical protein